MKTPTLVTFIRLLLIPVFFCVYYLPYSWAGAASAFIFAIAGVTDWLDGYLARKLKQVSDFGAFLDPVVDKLMVTVALVLLLADPQMPYLALPSAIIIGREIAISALREWMAELGERASVAVSYIGKVKTTVQIIAIVVLLACSSLKISLMTYFGYLLLYTAALLTFWSMCLYLKAAWPSLKHHK